MWSGGESEVSETHPRAPSTLRPPPPPPVSDAASVVLKHILHEQLRLRCTLEPKLAVSHIPRATLCFIRHTHTHAKNKKKIKKTPLDWCYYYLPEITTPLRMRRGGPRHAQRGKRGEGGVVKTMLSERGEGELQAVGIIGPGQVNASLSASQVKMGPYLRIGAAH